MQIGVFPEGARGRETPRRNGGEYRLGLYRRRDIEVPKGSEN